MKQLTVFICIIFSCINSFSQNNNNVIKSNKDYLLNSIVCENTVCYLDSNPSVFFKFKKFKKNIDNTLIAYAYVKKKCSVNSYLALDIRLSVVLNTNNQTAIFIWEDTHKGYNDRDNNKIVKCLKKTLNETYNYQQQNKTIILENISKTNKISLSTKE